MPPSTTDKILPQINTKESVGSDGSFRSSFVGPSLSCILDWRTDYRIRSIGKESMQIYVVRIVPGDAWAHYDRSANRFGISMDFTHIDGTADAYSSQYSSGITLKEIFGLTMSTTDAQKICDAIPDYGPFQITIAGKRDQFNLGVNVNYIRAMLTKMGKY